MTDDDASPPDGRAWDLLVIGGGTAGLVAAKTAAGFGASVLLADDGRTGGECLWTGCVPSKALLRAAHAAHDARDSARFGIHPGGLSVDFDAVRRHVRRAIDAIEPADSPASLREAGVRVVRRRARFTSPTSARVGAGSVSFRQALIATGSRPLLPPIPGLTAAAPLTNEDIWDVAELPGRLLVIGGGAVGCELGQAFARLGSAVTVVERATRLLPGEIVEAGTALRAAFEHEGIGVRCGVDVSEIAAGGAALSDGSTVAFDAVLVAAGRAPCATDLDLSAAGVEVDGAGWVRVDDLARTTCPTIWAAGDVTGPPLLTHVAGVRASLAASNAVLGLRRRIDPLVPRVTFTQPEIASVGARVGAAHIVEHHDVDRAVTDAQTHGFTQVLADRRGRVVGATIVGPRAGESVAEIALAIRLRVTMRQLAGLTHAYPTYADGVWKAAIADVQNGLRSGPARIVTTLLSWWRRVRLDRQRGDGAAPRRARQP